MTIDWKPNGFMTIDQTRLEYACFGPAPDKAPTLVLLHEGLGCVALWRDVPQRLVEATGCGVFAYSRAGYGQSDPASLPRPITYMTEEATGPLPKILRALAVKRAVLVGHSDGATIAAEYAGAFQEDFLKGLVLIAPHFFTEPLGLAEIAEAKRAYETTDLRAKMAKYHKDPDVAFYGWNEAWLNPSFAKWDVTKALETNSVPILAIQGADDQYGTLAQLDIIQQRCPSEVEIRVLPQTRHAPHLEATEVTVDEITQFCQRLMQNIA